MADTPDSPKRDYRDTVFLPKTDFPMKAGLAQKEPAILAKWLGDGLYEQLRRARAGRERFILHDGPPYANGDIHMGHAMNKVLKDIVVRTQSLLGKDAPYVPGWDCHGLPIEWKVEEAYRAKKLNKDEVPVDQFRAECRAYAAKWVDVQRDQFERLGVMGDWADPYLTMKFDAEAAIVGELLKFAETGQLYRGAKPVMWSPVEKTALAEAEVEYEDIVSTQIDVAFEIIGGAVQPYLRGFDNLTQTALDMNQWLNGARLVIWTTTPWTIPVNQAIAMGERVNYAFLETPIGKLIVAVDLVEDFCRRIGIKKGNIRYTATGSEFCGLKVRHPMAGRLSGVLAEFFDRDRPVLFGDFVTTDVGTGLVHMAPDHGEDDFLLCKAHGIDPVFAVDGDGRYRAFWPWLGGQGSVINSKFNAPDGPICKALDEAGALLAASADYAHSYPHSWRSKAKVIFRATPQWFIGMDAPLLPSRVREGLGVGLDADTGFDTNPPPDPLPQAVGGEDNVPTLRELALDAIAHTRWVPEKSRNRIQAMVAGRPDWVISRQRAWGVPIALYVDKRTGEYLRDPEVNARIVAAFEAGGADAWFGADHAALLGLERDPKDYEPQNDILDVWFDSGSTHAFTIEARYGEGVRADLYLEGSDQHRGWFQSSLLESCGTRGHAPYKGVFTHGFALDGQGRKMSKSVGNVVDPLKIIGESGADILRLWVASTDYFEDVRIGKEILAGTSDAYRKLRNTFRYLLGALDGFDESKRVAAAEMPDLERYMLHLLTILEGELRAASENYEFNRYARALSDFCNNDLSAFFFDIRKDSLYCDAADDPKRMAYRTVLDILFHALVRWAAPILCFTAEEVWTTRYPEGGSVHLLDWPELDADWADPALAGQWARLRTIRQIVSAEIEPKRRDKAIGSSLEAKVMIGLPDDRDRPDVTSEELAELLIVSDVGLEHAAHGPVAVVHRTDFHKCGRCWRHLPEVADDGELCRRCESVVDA